MSKASISTSQPTKRYWALVPAAGLGKRLGSELPKQYLKLHGKEILAWTLHTLGELEFLENIVLVLHPEDSYFSDYLADEFPAVSVVAGGEERQHSVANGLAFLESKLAENDWVMVHDAARPCVMPDEINHLKNALSENAVGGILATRVKDTLKQADSAGNIQATLNRTEYWLAATPQLFRFKVLSEALASAMQSRTLHTDEASAVEAMGLPVKLVEGSRENIKITTQEDLLLAEFLLKRLGKVNA